MLTLEETDDYIQRIQAILNIPCDDIKTNQWDGIEYILDEIYEQGQNNKLNEIIDYLNK